jgi:hypothetical protein
MALDRLQKGRTMNKAGATLVVVASIPLLILGVIFLIAAVNTPSRILVAAVFLLAGGSLLVWGALRLRRLGEISHDALVIGIVDLARRLDGEVTLAQVQAEFGIPQALAYGTLEKMRGQGDCERERRGDYDVYVFKSVLPAKAIKRCPYCGSEFAVRSAMRECPNCGGPLEIVKV